MRCLSIRRVSRGSGTSAEVLSPTRDTIERNWKQIT